MRLEICKENGESYFSEANLVNGEICVNAGSGICGNYLPENTYSWKINQFRTKWFLELLEKADVNNWPDTVPNDYSPDETADTCVPGTWTLRMTYRKEPDKPWVIYGKGPYPDTEPYNLHPLFLDVKLAAWTFEYDKLQDEEDNNENKEN